jgi:hypothetical protein
VGRGAADQRRADPSAYLQEHLLGRRGSAGGSRGPTTNCPTGRGAAEQLPVGEASGQQKEAFLNGGGKLKFVAGRAGKVVAGQWRRGSWSGEGGAAWRRSGPQGPSRWWRRQSGAGLRRRGGRVGRRRPCGEAEWGAGGLRRDGVGLRRWRRGGRVEPASAVRLGGQRHVGDAGCGEENRLGRGRAEWSRGVERVAPHVGANRESRRCAPA